MSALHYRERPASQEVVMSKKTLLIVGVVSALGLAVLATGILPAYAHCGKCLTDGKYFAGESWYKSNPIELRLYARGSRESLRKIFSHSFVRLTWDNGGRHHVNPSFSRDGMRLYYNKAVNENTSYAFSYDLTGLVSPMQRVGERNNKGLVQE